MVKVSDCSHMEIKKIYACTIQVTGKKVMCFLEVADVDQYNNTKRLTVSISNLYDLLISFNVEKMNRLIGKEARCLVHKKYKDINFIGPMSFDICDKDYIRCNEVAMV